MRFDAFSGGAVLSGEVHVLRIDEVDNAFKNVQLDMVRHVDM